MSILVTALASTFGKPVAERLFQALENRESGSKRIEKALSAIEKGATAIEALKQAFGKDFIKVLNDVLGSTNATFMFQAGTQYYTQQNESGLTPAQILRDEININLDRLTQLEVKDKTLKNLAFGIVAVWGNRCRYFYEKSEKIELIESHLKIMNELLSGDSRNYRQIYKLIFNMGISGVGTLMIIAGALLATSTGVGVVTAISTFMFGIPLINVGALVILGSILVVVSTRDSRPVDDVSLSVALAYKLIQRLENN